MEKTNIPKCVYPTGHLFFYVEIRNFTIVPKRPFAFLQPNAKFWKLEKCEWEKWILIMPEKYGKKQTLKDPCSQAVICFSQENKKFRIAPKLSFILWLQKKKFLKLFRSVTYLHIKVFGLTKTNLEKFDVIQVKIRSCSSSNFKIIEVIVVPTICSPLSGQFIELAKNQYTHLNNI